MAAGRFREDLSTVSRVTVQLPPLRERQEDIQLLSLQFVAAGAKRGEPDSGAAPRSRGLRCWRYSMAGQRPRAAERDRAVAHPGLTGGLIWAEQLGIIPRPPRDAAPAPATTPASNRGPPTCTRWPNSRSR